MSLQLVEPRPHGDDGFGPQLEHPRPCVLGQPGIGYDTCLQQHPQVLAQCGPADAELVRHLSGPPGDDTQQLHHLQPGRVPKRLQQVDDRRTISHESNSYPYWQ